jgi:DNA polymerase-3 subunit chi
LKKIALFYILNKAEDLKISVCKIIKEYYKKKYKIFVSSHSNDLVNELNNLLWTFEQISFIPHCTTKNYDKNSPILLSGKDSFPKIINLKEYDVWLNLDNEMEENYTDFEIILEIVSQNEEDRVLSRKRYLNYQKNNFEVKHEKL